jgi:hypothetical protein
MSSQAFALRVNASEASGRLASTPIWEVCPRPGAPKNPVQSAIRVPMGNLRLIAPPVAEAQCREEKVAWEHHNDARCRGIQLTKYLVPNFTPKEAHPTTPREPFQPTKPERSVTYPNPGTPEGRTSFVIPWRGCQMKMQGDLSREIEGTPQSLRGSQCGSVHTRYRMQRCGGRSCRHRKCNSVHCQV